MNRPANTRRPRGAVLIVVLGILVVLALLGTTFATLQSTERQVARNYLDTVRAKLLAQSGVEDALARIGSAISGGRLNDPALLFWGNNTTETGAPDASTPLERAKNPSYAWEDETVQNPEDANAAPALFTIDGRPLGISGKMESGTYGRNCDVYRLRVTEGSGTIHVNDGVENGPQGYVSQNLKRILNVLGNLVGVAGAGDRIVNGRPGRGYVAKKELEGVLGPADYEKLQPFVTAVAWVDPQVANPVPISATTLSAYPVRYNEQIAAFRYGRSSETSGALVSTPLVFAPDFSDPKKSTNHAVIALDELSAPWIEICARAPVNVNAAPREVLTALIVGLRGVFVVEQRRRHPNKNVYNFLHYKQWDNHPRTNGRRGDEYGYLYATVPFVAPGTTGAEGIDASMVADEIIACRGRQISPHCAGLDYSKVWYGGPFSSWRQFNAFCDGLTTGGLLQDNRPIYYDYWDAAETSYSGGLGTWITSPSALQARVGGQALADVLKANFNPNLTLNETNPDANLFLLVDKTDLIVNSTEFCFAPMGYFEIESEGVVLRPNGGTDLLQTRSATVVARRSVTCSVRAFEVYRHTSQQDFVGGEASPAPDLTTSAGGTIQVAPEPDFVPAARECRWSGWIQLATMGGAGGHAGPELGDAAHAHFDGSHDLHHHANGAVQVLRPTAGAYRNHPDRTEPGNPGPYGPLLGPPGRYRLARTWEQIRPPAAAEIVAMSDLRLDGAYVERDSAVMYSKSADLFDLSGTIAYWIKPSFFPEMAGKPRTFFSMDRIIDGFDNDQPPRPKKFQVINAHWFLASHDNPSFGASPWETSTPTYMDAVWRPASMMAGYSRPQGDGGGVGSITPSLNHRSHPDASLKADHFRHHGWVHVAYFWNMKTHETKLFVNGRLLPSTTTFKTHPDSVNSLADFLPDPLRLGEPSLTMAEGRLDDGVMEYTSRNWSADATIDEFYIWKGDHLLEAQDLFHRGRYYLPRPGKEASFTSQEISLALETTVRHLPPPAGKSAAALPPAALPQVRLLGAAWTWYPESTASDGTPKLRDYFTGQDLDVEVEMRIRVNGVETDDVLRRAEGGPLGAVVLSGADKFQYRLILRVPGASLDTVLLATPVVDDVTFYFTRGVELLSYMMR